MERVNRSVVPIAIALIAAWIVSPALSSGWHGDDAFYSGLPGALESGRTTLLGAMQHSSALWSENGRWYPGLIVEKYAVFALFTDRFAYKALLIALTLAALEIFRRLVLACSDRATANAAAFCAVLALQIRGYHDPFLGYNGMIQVVAIATFVSLLALRKALVERDRLAGVLAVVTYVLAASIYEIVYLFGILHAVLAIRLRGFRAGLLAALPFGAIGAALAIWGLLARSGAHIAAANPYATSADPAGYAHALRDQLTAALPLSYFFYDPSEIFPRWSTLRDLVHMHPNPFLALALALVAWAVFADPPKTTRRDLVALGAALWILPALLIPTLQKYQHELRPGLGYLPVFIEYTGVGLLGAMAVAWLVRRIPRRGLIVTLIVAATAIGTLTEAANRRVVAVIAPSYRVARDDFESALRGGLLAAVPQGATVAFATPFPWVCADEACPDGIGTADVIYRFARRRVVVQGSGGGYTLAYDARTHAWTVRSRSTISPRKRV